MKLLKKRKEKRAAKKAAIDAAPGTSRLEKRLNVAGAKARAKKAQRQKVKEAKKASTTKLSDKQAAEFEKFAGVKSTVVAKKPKPGDRIVSSKPKAKVVQPEKKEISKVDRTAGMTFNQAFAAARKAGQKRFEWRGKSYNTKLKGEAKHGGAVAIMIAPVKAKKMKAVKKAKMGAKLKEVPSDNKGLGKLPKEVRNKMGYMKNGGKIGSKMNDLISQQKALQEKLSRAATKDSIMKSEFTVAQVRKMKSDLKSLDAKIKELKGAGSGTVEKATPLGKRVGKDGKKLMYGGAMKKAMYGANMKKKAMYGAKLKKK